MKQFILALLPVLVFIMIAGLGFLLIWIWNKYFAKRNKELANRLKEIASFRQSAGDGFLRINAQNKSALFNWLEKKVAGNNALQLLLIRSGSQKQPAEVVMMSLGLFALGGVFSKLIGIGGLINAVFIALGFSLIPWLYFSQRAKKRRMQFEDQLPEALDFISRSLRAGHGLVISMGMVSDELPDPVGTEFKITFDELNFGIPFQEAMTNMMVRVNSPDLTFFTVAVTIQRETGGNLTELLAGLAKTIRERVKLKGKVRVLASEGKFSGYLLGVLPFIMGIILNFTNPKYMEPLWFTPQGHDLIGAGLIMMALGALWMRVIVQIRV